MQIINGQANELDIYNNEIQNITQIIHSCYPYGNLYIGNEESIQFIQLKNIDTIVISSELYDSLIVSGNQDATVILKTLDIRQVQFQQLTIKNIHELSQFLEQRLKKYNVLVQCSNGNSYSPILVIAYLIRSYEWNYEKAYTYIWKQRRSINILEQYSELLSQYYITLYSPADINQLPINGLKYKLFIGSIDAISLLKKYEIGAIISLLDTKVYIPNYIHLSITLEDDPTQCISKVFQTCCQFLDEQLSHTNVLVHCRAGISRSPTIGIAYLIWKGFSYEEGIRIMRRCRRCSKPNKGFKEQLRLFYNDIKHHKQ